MLWLITGTPDSSATGTAETVDAPLKEAGLLMKLIVEMHLHLVSLALNVSVKSLGLDLRPFLLKKYTGDAIGVTRPHQRDKKQGQLEEPS